MSVEMRGDSDPQLSSKAQEILERRREAQKRVAEAQRRAAEEKAQADLADAEAAATAAAEKAAAEKLAAERAAAEKAARASIALAPKPEKGSGLQARIEDILERHGGKGSWSVAFHVLDGDSASMTPDRKSILLSSRAARPAAPDGSVRSLVRSRSIVMAHTISGSSTRTIPRACAERIS